MTTITLLLLLLAQPPPYQSRDVDIRVRCDGRTVLVRKIDYRGDKLLSYVGHPVPRMSSKRWFRYINRCREYESAQVIKQSGLKGSGRYFPEREGK